jgi:predicted component of type VI protein secretion system
MDSDVAIDRASQGWAIAPHRRRAAAVVLALALIVLLAACGSSSKPKLSTAQVKKRTCQQVEAALSDGPDPEADPVGHAQAQILPLRQIHTTDGTLHQAIDTLASAYQSFSTSNGSSSANSAVSAASKTIEHLCPGIES